MQKFFSKQGLTVFFLSLFLNPFAQANLGESSFYGSRGASLGGGMAGKNSGAYASFYNPAQLGIPEEKRFTLSWGFGYFQPNFKSINGVITQNTFNSAVTSGNEESGNVAHDYASTIGQFFAAKIRIWPEFKNLTIGFTSFTPLPNVATLDTGESYIPEYFLYRSRTQRPQIEVGAGIELSKQFYFGIGGQTTFQVSNDTEAFLATSASKTSSMRIKTTIQPKFSPHLGLFYDPSERVNIGLVVRLPADAQIENDVSIAAEVLGGAGTPHFVFSTLSSLAYQPLAFELGTEFTLTPTWKVSGQVNYERWSIYRVPAIQITNDNGATVISNTTGIGGTFKDIVVVMLGNEIIWAGKTLRFGYSYRPQILSANANENFNYLDPDKHQINVGAGIPLSPTWTLDVHLAYHLLIADDVQKSTSTLIGAPGYEVGGNLFGGSLSFTVGF